MKKMIIGNWKMNGSSELVRTFSRVLRDTARWDTLSTGVVICPPFLYLPLCIELFYDFPELQFGSQNVFIGDQGAFTGEISAKMLADLHVNYCIVGHSERRQLFGETDQMVSLKVKALLASSVVPIVCVGEQLLHREQGLHQQIVQEQLFHLFQTLSATEQQRCAIAYEPIWAIGTGKTASLQEAEEMHSTIRQWIQNYSSRETAQSIKILYGGSVKPENAEVLLAEPNIDGLLVGGASLVVNDFYQIIKFASQQRKTAY